MQTSLRAPVRTSARLSARGGAALRALAALACAGCGGGTPHGKGDRAARPAHGQERVLSAPPARALDRYASELGRSHAARVAAAKRWGLAEVPLTPPAPPARKPTLETREGFEVDGHRTRRLPPVFTTVPTRQRVVFLTVDDGAEKDPAFLRMMSELNVPYSAFLSNYLVKDDYGYFGRMQDSGVTLNNHTLRHRFLPDLSYKAQKREICGMQNVIEKRYGKRPVLFRPPYGDYDRDTLRAAKACGIKAVPLWNAEVFADRWEYREWDRDIHPGDIVLTHFRGKDDWNGTMPDMVRRFLKLVTDKGYAVARLEDYL
ncbi:polysaccharide deacetylase family protein [Streptomyces poonensis]|uniref:polysaccharide deacetylase family protein n=1 Tax=Streptomyces poonensis TaxID=68255 RepID=UPI0022F2F00C|nr:polysaccharide deacetylase family protein [Streptomyces poonensis]